MDLFVLVLELLGTVAFALSGALLAARKRMDLFGVCVMGLVSACGGGVLRDILAGLPPYIFVRHVYACASLAGAALCAGLWRQTGQITATLVCCGSVTLIRLLAARFRWSLPKARYEDDPGEGTIC